MVKITLISNNPRENFMVADTKTVKEILDERSIVYANAATSLDGATLGVADMNKSLHDLGVTERAVIAVLAHKDNAAKAVVNGAACVVTSELSAEQIIRFRKYHPEALTMFDEANDPVFAIDYDETTPGSININGAVFGGTTDVDGHAQITILLDPVADNREELVYNEIGAAMLKLNEIEEQLLGMISELDAEEAKIRESIMVL